MSATRFSTASGISFDAGYGPAPEDLQRMRAAGAFMQLFGKPVQRCRVQVGGRLGLPCRVGQRIGGGRRSGGDRRDHAENTSQKTHVYSPYESRVLSSWIDQASDVSQKNA
jgi:hypothetical protein